MATERKQNRHQEPALTKASPALTGKGATFENFAPKPFPAALDKKRSLATRPARKLR